MGFEVSTTQVLSSSIQMPERSCAWPWVSALENSGVCEVTMLQLASKTPRQIDAKIRIAPSPKPRLIDHGAESVIQRGLMSPNLKHC